MVNLLTIQPLLTLEPSNQHLCHILNWKTVLKNLSRPKYLQVTTEV